MSMKDIHQENTCYHTHKKTDFSVVLKDIHVYEEYTCVCRIYIKDIEETYDVTI